MLFKGVWASRDNALYNLKLIVNVRRILLVTHMALRLHLVGKAAVVLRDLALAIAVESIATEVRVVGVEIGLCLFGEFGICLRDISICANMSRKILTCTRPHTKSNGKPYRSTVSTNTRRVRACIQIMALSLYPVRPSRSASPHSFFASCSSWLASLASSSFPPSLYL